MKKFILISTFATALLATPAMAQQMTPEQLARVEAAREANPIGQSAPAAQPQMTERDRCNALYVPGDETSVQAQRNCLRSVRESERELSRATIRLATLSSRDARQARRDYERRIENRRDFYLDIADEAGDFIKDVRRSRNRR